MPIYDSLPDRSNRSDSLSNSETLWFESQGFGSIEWLPEMTLPASKAAKRLGHSDRKVPAEAPETARVPLAIGDIRQPAGAEFTYLLAEGSEPRLA